MAPTLNRKKKSIFMARQSFDFFALDQIRFKRVCNFIRKVQNDLFAAFSGDDKGILFKVKIINVQAYTFADADAPFQETAKAWRHRVFS